MSKGHQMNLAVCGMNYALHPDSHEARLLEALLTHFNLYIMKTDHSTLPSFTSNLWLNTNGKLCAENIEVKFTIHRLRKRF